MELNPNYYNPINNSTINNYMIYYEIKYIIPKKTDEWNKKIYNITRKTMLMNPPILY